jgi:hypothetical protein
VITVPLLMITFLTLRQQHDHQNPEWLEYRATPSKLAFGLNFEALQLCELQEFFIFEAGDFVAGLCLLYKLPLIYLKSGCGLARIV